MAALISIVTIPLVCDGFAVDTPALIVIVAIPGYPPPVSTLVIVAPDAKLTVVAAVPALIQDPACFKERPALTPVSYTHLPLPTTPYV